MTAHWNRIQASLPPYEFKRFEKWCKVHRIKPNKMIKRALSFYFCYLRYYDVYGKAPPTKKFLKELEYHSDVLQYMKTVRRGIIGKKSYEKKYQVFRNTFIENFGRGRPRMYKLYGNRKQVKQRKIEWHSKNHPKSSGKSFEVGIISETILKK